MVTFFCPYCWREVNKDIDICPMCDENIQAYHFLDYEEKLLLALNHPVRETRLIAVKVLGKIRSSRGVPFLYRILKNEMDYYLIKEVLYALREINTPESLEILHEAAEHPVELVKKLAKKLI